MKLLIFLAAISLVSAIKLNQYLDSSCSNLFQTYYFNLNDCFMAGNGANGMNYTFCNGTYFNALIYSGTTCSGNPIMTMSGDPRVCALERRLVFCNENAPPSSPTIKSFSPSTSINMFLAFILYCIINVIVE